MSETGKVGNKLKEKPMEKLIYRSQTKKWYNKYTKVRSEYYQDNDIVKKYTVTIRKGVGRGEGWSEYSTLKSSWQIDDPLMPDWLHSYIDYKAVSEFMITKISERNANQVQSKLIEFEELGYIIDEFDANQWIVFSSDTALVCTNPKSLHPWNDIKHLIVLAYQRQRMSSKLLKKFQDDWFSKRIDYPRLLEQAKTNDLILAASAAQQEKEKQDKINAEKYDEINFLLNRMRENLQAVIPKISDRAADELNLIIELSHDLEVTQYNYEFLYREARKIMIAENKRNNRST